MTIDFTNAPEIIDSRDVIERIEELESFAEYIEELAEDPDENYDELIDVRDEYDADEYDALVEFRDSGADLVSDWEHGETFIREDAFTDYAMELLSGIGYLPADMPGWIVIDREETADNMKIDYTEYTFRGETYYARA